MLTPLDIENKRFSKTLKGYNVDEVDDFLDQLTIDYEKLYKENSELKEQIDENKKELEHYKSVEKTLQNTLLMAQTASEDIKTNAQERANQIIRDAENEAKRATETISKEEFEIRKRTEELKRQFDVYKAKMEALLISQLELLQDKNNEE